MGRESPLKIEMKCQCFVLLLAIICASVIQSTCKVELFNRVRHVVQSELSLNTISSNTGIRSHGMCALYCKDKDCMSFAYREIDKRWDTYSQLIFGKTDANISSSTLYFSKVVASGVYKLTTTQREYIDVFFDMDTEEGPWIVIQRRTCQDVDFCRDWEDYKNGFGDLRGNFWIGIEKLHLLTSTPRIICVELEDWNGTKGYAQYSSFQVANGNQNYSLFVEGFSGNVSYDALAYHNGYPFSTYDRDNGMSIRCTDLHNGGLWYSSCSNCNLNGVQQDYAKEITCQNFTDPSKCMPLKKSKMMIH